jgi:hypothetical protein
MPNYEFAYTPEPWATQLKNPQNRIEKVGRAVVEAAGGKFIDGWLCMGSMMQFSSPTCQISRACRGRRDQKS